MKADSKQRYDLILETSAGVKLATYAHPTEVSSSTSDAPVPSADSASAPVVSSAEEVKAATSGLKEGESDGIWWIKARQGHSIKVCRLYSSRSSIPHGTIHVKQTVQLDLKPITSIADIPTGLAIHGTNGAAWASIGGSDLHFLDSKSFTIIIFPAKEGLSKMKRNHIHLAQNVAGKGVVSGT